MPEAITSRNNGKVKLAFSYKDHPGEFFLVEGFHLVEEAIQDEAVEMIFRIKDFKSNVKEDYLVTPEIIDKLSSSRSPEGIVALCRKKEKKLDYNADILILDRVQDPGNLGTLLRTALAFGIHNVILTEMTASPYNAKSIQASQGAIFSLNIEEKVKGPSCIEDLKKHGYAVYGTALEGAKPLETYPLSKDKVALILGNEGQGVSKELLSLTDANLKISMGGIDSLNVAIAGGILMHALSQRRQEK